MLYGRDNCGLLIWFVYTPVFLQLKNELPEMNSEISLNLPQFPEIEEGHSVC